MLGARGHVAAVHGQYAVARSAYIQMADLLQALPLRANAGHMALAMRDIELAREDLSVVETSGVHGPAADIDRMVLSAGIAALDGRSIDALALYRDALRGWRSLGLVWDEAVTGLEMATLLDPSAT